MTDHRPLHTLELVKDADIYDADIYTSQWYYYLSQNLEPQVKSKPARKCLDSGTKLLIDQVLVENPSWANMTRALDILEDWLQGCANQAHQQSEAHEFDNA
jgi:hypothetical protein